MSDEQLQRFADRFVIECEIGAGGMGRVLRARDEAVGRPTCKGRRRWGSAITERAERYLARLAERPFAELLWLDRCALLEPLRERASCRELRRFVVERLAPLGA